MTQFNRSVSLIVGSGLGVGIEIKDLKISFTVKKTTDKTENVAEIQIWNLSNDTRNQLDQNFFSDNKNKVFLSAGYKSGDGEKIVFVGDITELNHIRERPEIITVIKGEDGKKDLNSIKSSLSFGKDASAKDILRAMLRQFPTKNNLNEVSFKDVILKNGFSFSGLTKSGITTITQLLKLDWSVQDDEIRVIPFDGNNSTTIVSLSPSNGMIGFPVRISHSTEKAKGKAKTLKQGWEIKSLLRPEIVAGGRVDIDSVLVPAKASFDVVSVVHQGDNYEGEFMTKTEVKE